MPSPRRGGVSFDTPSPVPVPFDSPVPVIAYSAPLVAPPSPQSPGGPRYAGSPFSALSYSILPSFSTPLSKRTQLREAVAQTDVQGVCSSDTLALGGVPCPIEKPKRKGKKGNRLSGRSRAPEPSQKSVDAEEFSSGVTGIIEGLMNHMEHFNKTSDIDAKGRETPLETIDIDAGESPIETHDDHDKDHHRDHDKEKRSIACWAAVFIGVLLFLLGIFLGVLIGYVFYSLTDDDSQSNHVHANNATIITNGICCACSTTTSTTQDSAVIVVAFEVGNVDYDKLMANETLLGAFTLKVKETLVSEVGDAIPPSNVDLALSRGSVRVSANVTTPTNLVTLMHGALSSSKKLSMNLVESLSTLSGIESIKTGVIVVRDLSVQAPEHVSTTTTATVLTSSSSSSTSNTTYAGTTTTTSTTTTSSSTSTSTSTTFSTNSTSSTTSSTTTTNTTYTGTTTSNTNRTSTSTSTSSNTSYTGKTTASNTSSTSNTTLTTAWSDFEPEPTAAEEDRRLGVFYTTLSPSPTPSPTPLLP